MKSIHKFTDWHSRIFIESYHCKKIVGAMNFGKGRSMPRLWVFFHTDSMEQIPTKEQSFLNTKLYITAQL